MKIALTAGEDQHHLQFIRQLGLNHVVSGAPISDIGIIELETLERRKDHFEKNELIWDVIENLPPLSYNKVMFGSDGRDEQIDNVCKSIENIGAAGIGVLQYQWMLLGGLRTEYSPTGRGGARYPRFDMKIAEQMPAACLDWLGEGPAPHPYPHVPDRSIASTEVWENLVYFLKCIVPVAETAGVRLAVHPDDAPVANFMGVARILIDWNGLQRAIDSVPSEHNGLGFCMGTIGTMEDVNVPEAIKHFGGQNKIFFAHFRNPRGRVPVFDEVFPDEGDIDMVEAVQAFKTVDYEGVIRIDHCPGVIGDNSHADRSFAFQVGYLKGLLQSFEELGRTAL
tara:strand:+ start:166 stop:1179 length:1014 start_codon:yes stop_codon:yes gene_type:complete